MTHITQMLQDPMNIYAVSFVIFIALAFIYGRKSVAGWLDGEIAKIRAELDTARDLRAEAETALAASKAKQSSAEGEARMILEMAKREADALRAKSATDLATAIARHEQLAAERIRLAQNEAMNDVRRAAIDAAMKIARTTLTDAMSDTDATRLVDQAISDIPALKTSTPKAA